MSIIRDLETIFYTNKRHRDREKSLEVKVGKSKHVMGSNFKSKNS